MAELSLSNGQRRDLGWIVFIKLTWTKLGDPGCDEYATLFQPPRLANQLAYTQMPSD